MGHCSVHGPPNRAGNLLESGLGSIQHLPPEGPLLPVGVGGVLVGNSVSKFTEMESQHRDRCGSQTPADAEAAAGVGRAGEMRPRWGPVAGRE